MEPFSPETNRLLTTALSMRNWLFGSIIHTDAIEGMVRVADYINEMQRISETYSSLFDSMLKQSGLSEVSWPHVYSPQLSVSAQIWHSVNSQNNIIALVYLKTTPLLEITSVFLEIVQIHKL